MAKYRTLRNECNRLVRRESKAATAQKIMSSNNPAAMWKTVSNIIRPKSNKKLMLSVGGEELTDEKEIADTFGKFFVDKVKRLRENIDKSYICDPTSKLREKNSEKKRPIFAIRPVSEDEVKQAISAIKPKTSSGLDGISPKMLRLVLLRGMLLPITMECLMLVF